MQHVHNTALSTEKNLPYLNTFVIAYVLCSDLHKIHKGPFHVLLLFCLPTFSQKILDLQGNVVENSLQAKDMFCVAVLGQDCLP